MSEGRPNRMKMCKRVSPRVLFALFFPLLVFLLYIFLSAVIMSSFSTGRSPAIHPKTTMGKFRGSWFHEKMTKTEKFPIQMYNQERWKRILFWTDVVVFSNDTRYYGISGIGADRFLNAKCPIWQCELHDFHVNDSSNLLRVEDYDALIFYDTTWNPRSSRPEKRLPHQRYVFWSQEAPGLQSHIQEWNQLTEFFNWTMTYRWDSDIVHPYGWLNPVVQNITSRRSKGTKNFAEGKSKLVVWFVSNCWTYNGRDDYVERLQEFLQVDVYGRCGTLSCPRSNEESCQQMAERDYKFAIAFENSLCLDYVTEKFFRRISYNIVPVVLDLHGNYAKIAPEKSYINALDFPSVRALADYLKLLDGNDELYNEYFWWKGSYNVYFDSGPDNWRGLCRLCSLLHGPIQPSTIYNNLTNWWHAQSQCKVLEFPDDDTSRSYIWTTKSFIPKS